MTLTPSTIGPTFFKITKGTGKVETNISKDKPLAQSKPLETVFFCKRFMYSQVPVKERREIKIPKINQITLDVKP